MIARGAGRAFCHHAAAGERAATTEIECKT